MENLQDVYYELRNEMRVRYLQVVEKQLQTIPDLEILSSEVCKKFTGHISDSHFVVYYLDLFWKISLVQNGSLIGSLIKKPDNLFLNYPQTYNLKVIIADFKRIVNSAPDIFEPIQIKNRVSRANPDFTKLGFFDD